MRTKQHCKQGALVASTAFPRTRRAVGPARDWVRVWCLEVGVTEDRAETSALLLSELATNAVEYAEGDRFEVTLWSAPLSVEVRDGSPKKPERREPSDDEDEHGRGLVLVYALSSHFEVNETDDGKSCRFWLGEA
ncbi:hypothetical protein DMB38_20380 [Streptomyces sp. WAC 06738]|uniref:ATP-binding protein n=1 Tax=Streptomyces sp. WAC 06738 TaxID=2203210 RepID=UPI000F6F2164|nr:ATP-binding protein [Streptomyces sp. WAC 06738]AZM50877.1 hypothetical protein DMB38_20380 [Streptomyces sp. WAC 06738]